MRVRAIVMAGGRGLRMAPHATLPKPLVRLAGVPLIERSMRALSRFGVRDLTVVVPAHTPAIGAFVASLRSELERDGARVEIAVETSPRGNIGAASLAAGRCDAALVLFADNVTDMDLGALLAHHHRASADVTLAAHVHETLIPFGEIVLDGPRVTAYREKPTLRTPVCSGVYVLSDPALRAIPPEGPVRADELVSARAAAGERVVAWFHDALWFDVNDAAALERAEEALKARGALP